MNKNDVAHVECFKKRIEKCMINQKKEYEKQMCACVDADTTWTGRNSHASVSHYDPTYVQTPNKRREK